MSLDVYLIAAVPLKKAPGSGIFIRENGSTREVSEQEWQEKNPGRDPVRALVDNDEETNEVYSANITHNLGRMAKEAGIYEALWRPEEIGVSKAAALVPLLRAGLLLLRSDPGRFDLFNPDNGWGDYNGLVEFVCAYLQACEQYPDAVIRVSR